MTPMFWVLLSSAGTVSGLSIQLSPPYRPEGRRERWGGDTARVADLN